MKKYFTVLSFFGLLMLMPYASKAHAALVSNLKDPGMLRQDWQTRRTNNGVVAHPGLMDTTCQSSSDLTWLLNSVDIGTKVCDPISTSANTAVWSTTSTGGKAVTMTLDNSKNTPSLQCTQIRNFFGIGAPWGYNRVLYLDQLSQLFVKAKVKNQSAQACQSNVCSPTCFSDPARFNPSGHGWVNLIIGFPMYDETYNRNLWVELVLYDTPGWYNATNGAPYNPLDPNFANSTYFHGSSSAEEFYRIYVTHAYVNDRTWLPPGQEHLYNIDFKSIVNTIRSTGGWQSTIDWSKVHLSDAYIGVELFGDARSTWTVSDFDVLYEEAPTNTASPIGYFDGVHPTQTCTVYGWTCDADRYSEPLEIQLFEGSTQVNTTPIFANQNFEAPQLCGNTPLHRFSYTFPAGPIRNNQPHQITARAENIGINSDGTVATTGFVQLPLSAGVSNTVTCAPLPSPSPSPSPSSPIFTPSDIRTLLGEYLGNDEVWWSNDTKTNILDAVFVMGRLE